MSLSIPQRYLIWVGVNLIGLIVISLSKIRISCGRLPENSWWRKWLAFKEDPTTGATYFQLNFNTFTPFQRVNNLKEIIVALSIMFYYGNVYQKYQSADDFYYLFGFLFAPIFGFIDRIKGMNFTISPSSLRSLSLQAKITLISLVLTCSSLIGYHLYLASIARIMAPYLGAMFTIPLLYLFWYQMFLKEHDGRPSWHVHHWFIGFYFSLLWRFDDPISKIAFAFFYTVHLQGAYFFGFMPIIYEKNAVFEAVTIDSDYFGDSGVDEL